MSYQSRNIKEVQAYDNYTILSAQPGKENKIYIDKATKTAYFWNGTSYEPLTPPATAGVSVYVQASSSTKPSPAVEGDELIVTDTGLVSGTILESWLYDATTSTWIQRPNDKVLDVLTTAQTAPTIGSGNTTNLGKIFKDASGNSYIVDYNGDAIQLSSPPLVTPASILAANACVNNVVNVPSGNPSDIRTIGTGGDFADLQTALLSASVVDGTILKLLNGLSTSTTINVNKAVVIDFDGNQVVSDSANPVTMFNVTAGATLKNGLLSHLKTTNTSIETVVSINSPTAPVYIINNEIRIQEFGIVARGQFYIGDNTFSYIGASATNSHRFIMLYGVANESRIYNNEFTASALQGTTRYSNFIYATSTTGTSYSGKLFINDNTQTGGDLRQFFLHDSGVPTNMELYVANNTFNDFNGGIGIVGVNVYNGYSKIGIYNNTQGADSAGNYKGLFFVDGTGAINENVVLEYGDNTLGTTALRADYLSYALDDSSEITIKNTITFVDLKEKVSIQDSLSDLGLLIQDLKSRKTYIEGASGSGTKEDPYIIIPSEETKITTTSLTPQHFNAGWVDSSNTASNTVAKAMELSDGSLVNNVTVEWVGHGLDIGEIYYLDSVTGGFTKVIPTYPKYTQQLFIVKDANTIHIDIEQAYRASEDVTQNITYQNSSITKPSDPNKGDLLFVTADGTRSGAIIEQWLYDGVEWIKIGESASGGVVVSGTIIDNTITDSDTISTVGRYIVPSTGTANAFVGQENNYADWYGELDGVTNLPIGFTFETPASGDKVVITSGTNAGKIFSFDGTDWTLEEGTAAVPSAGQLLTITNGSTIFSSGTNPPWSDVVGGIFTIPSAGKWNIEYNLTVTNNTSNWQQARIVSATGVFVDGSMVGEGPSGALNSPITMTGFAQIDITAPGTFKLQARTFNGSTLTIRNVSNSNTGQSIIKWTKAVDFPIVAVAPNIIIEQNYINVSNSVDVANLTTNSDLAFNVQVSSAGAIQYNPTTGVFSGLKSGKTYDLSAYFAFSSFSNTTNGYVVVHWVNSATNTTLPNIGKALLLPVNRGTNETIQSFAGGIFTAPSDMSVKLRIVASDGTATMRGQNFSSASIQEVTGVALDPALIPVNDQTDSGFFDIGNMRIQRGTVPDGVAATRTITLPAAFANLNYHITYGSGFTNDGLVRSVNTVSKTTTSFQAQNRHQNGATTMGFDWIAIGRKP